MGDQSYLLDMHSNNGPMDDLGRRFVACFDIAADDGALPDDPEFRRVLHDYMTWAVSDVLVFAPMGSEVPPGVRMPHWGWDGLVEKD
jgi:hemoglobin